jgi:preprotein translocase subunit SecG
LLPRYLDVVTAAYPRRVARRTGKEVRFAPMRRVRITTTLITVAILLLTFAPAALARDDGGEGWYGETTDKAITNLMFLVIIFFPTLCLVLTLIQARLDKRKHAKLDAKRRREGSADWRGGW